MQSKILQFAPGAAFYLFALGAQVSGFTDANLALALLAIGTLLSMAPGAVFAWRSVSYRGSIRVPLSLRFDRTLELGSSFCGSPCATC
jgi:TRAP-type mannitol/chloroaromatic compound transport system permease large subunit